MQSDATCAKFLRTLADTEACEVSQRHPNKRSVTASPRYSIKETEEFASTMGKEVVATATPTSQPTGFWRVRLGAYVHASCIKHERQIYLIRQLQLSCVSEGANAGERVDACFDSCPIVETTFGADAEVDHTNECYSDETWSNVVLVQTAMAMKTMAVPATTRAMTRSSKRRRQERR
jgi:hypothetical protein